MLAERILLVVFVASCDAAARGQRGATLAPLAASSSSADVTCTTRPLDTSEDGPALGREQRWVTEGEPYTAVSFFGDRSEEWYPGPNLHLYPQYEEGTYPIHSTWYMWYYLGNDTMSPQRGSERSYPMLNGGYYNETRCLMDSR